VKSRFTVPPSAAYLPTKNSRSPSKSSAETPPETKQQPAMPAPTAVRTAVVGFTS
jgi:hypothetical protein